MGIWNPSATYENSADARLYVERVKGETWRDCVRRVARAGGLEMDALETFDRDRNTNRAQAAFDALYDWDLCSVSPSHRL